MYAKSLAERYFKMSIRYKTPNTLFWTNLELVTLKRSVNENQIKKLLIIIIKI